MSQWQTIDFAADFHHCKAHWKKDESFGQFLDYENRFSACPEV